MNVKAEDLGAAIADTLQAYAEATGEALERGIDITAEEAAMVVREKAKSYGWTRYASSIVPRSGPKIRKKGVTNYKAYVAAEAPDYRVAHLLEHGHAIIAGGRYLGDTKPRPHFEAGEEYAYNHIVENIRKEME